ncbi:MAG: IS630 family transposase [Polyangiaceae bacterium]|nr:IS630 family transposase [Polyangiaceae bacterium]
MIRISISPADIERLRNLRQSALKPAERDRIEMLLLHAEGWSAPRIGRFLSYSDEWVRQVLNARYRRTRASLRHRQDRVARQRGRRQLGAYRALARKGRLRLVFFDECGFSPSQSTGRSWFLPEQIRDRPYESPQGKRATALAMYAPYGRRRHLRAEVLGKKVTTERILRTLRRIPHSRRKKTVVVLDNAPVHRSKLAQEGFHVLEEKGLKVLFLPPYSPDLNRVEVELGIVKYHHLPERTYFMQGHLERAVARAFQERALVLSRRAAN